MDSPKKSANTRKKSENSVKGGSREKGESVQIKN